MIICKELNVRKSYPQNINNRKRGKKTDFPDSCQRDEIIEVGSINSIFYFLHKAAEPFNCLEQDNLA